ncbi:MAG: hypothetical protein JW965_07355 [Bacteroidales bacterium]|nr:hypothetical protein [Bacteroidales bacterium]
MKELERIIKQLKLYKPEIDGRDSLRESIMQNIRRKKRKINYLFVWTEIVWLRRSLAIASVAIIAVFVLQQLFVINRIDKLEERMVSFNTEKILEYQRENVILNSVLFEEQFPGVLTDSIKVASEDLLDLVRSYSNLQNKYEEMLGTIKKNRSESTKQKL